MKETCSIKPYIGILMALLPLLSLKGSAQSEQSSIPRDTLIKAAREIIIATPFCLIMKENATEL